MIFFSLASNTQYDYVGIHHKYDFSYTNIIIMEDVPLVARTIVYRRLNGLVISTKPFPPTFTQGQSLSGP